jgi:transcriptional regulator with XRE-family HTH domain
MKNADENDPESRMVLFLFRHSLLLGQGEFARIAGIAPSQLSAYERGKRATPREVLEKAAVAAGFPVQLLDAVLWLIRSFRAAASGRSHADRVLADGTSAELIALIRMITDVILEPGTLESPGGSECPAAQG